MIWLSHSSQLLNGHSIIYLIMCSVRSQFEASNGDERNETVIQCIDVDIITVILYQVMPYHSYLRVGGLVVLPAVDG